MSQINFDTWKNEAQSKTYYGAQAWINFGWVAGTPTIKASKNVSSLTDDGTGVVTINFTTAFADTNYAGVFSATFLQGTYNNANICYASTGGTSTPAVKTTTAAKLSNISGILNGTSTAAASTDVSEAVAIFFAN